MSSTMRRSAMRAGLVVVGLLAALSAQAVVVNFPDPNLDAAVRSAIGKPTGDILTTDLVGTGFTLLTANFALDGEYILIYTAGAGGMITGMTPQTVFQGGSGAPVTATPNAGYHFVSWTDGSTINLRTDSNVTANISVTAPFALNTFIWGDVALNGDDTNNWSDAQDAWLVLQRDAELIDELGDSNGTLYVRPEYPLSMISAGINPALLTSNFLQKNKILTNSSTAF